MTSQPTIEAHANPFPDLWRVLDSLGAEGKLLDTLLARHSVASSVTFLVSIGFFLIGLLSYQQVIPSIPIPVSIMFIILVLFGGIWVFSTRRRLNAHRRYCQSVYMYAEEVWKKELHEFSQHNRIPVLQQMELDLRKNLLDSQIFFGLKLSPEKSKF